MSQPSENNRVAAAPAGVARRLGALLYDSLLILAIWMITALIAVLVRGEAVNPFVMQIISVVEVVVFYGYFWADRGQTLGMRAWRLVLVDNADRNVGLATQQTVHLQSQRLAVGRRHPTSVAQRPAQSLAPSDDANRFFGRSTTSGQTAENQTNAKIPRPTGCLSAIPSRKVQPICECHVMDSKALGPWYGQ